jgi:para-aminobenzoate synthetase/4-amino-4-deoxychorismate lyase
VPPTSVPVPIRHRMFLQAAMRMENQPTSVNYLRGPAIWIARSGALNSKPRDNSRTVRNEIEALIQLDARRWIRLTDPLDIIQTRRIEDVARVLDDVEKLTLVGGYHAAGFVSYEAGAAFGLSTRHAQLDLPLVWFAVFDRDHVRPADPPVLSGDFMPGPLRASVERPEYRSAVRFIRQRIADGDTYQVNYTLRLSGPFTGDPRDLFANLVLNQAGRHSAYLHLGSHTICSASPELFFGRDGRQLTARPMKGTVARGRTAEEDLLRRAELYESPKQRAENVMIVDMVRNDLGRVADFGSVCVPELFALERYPSVWQMTSLVTARTSASLSALFAALHPSASVTGAPKVSTMAIVGTLEPAPRGVYTGAIGYLTPDGTARFNVAIRTAVLDHRRSMLDFGVGSGIVWDSDADAEYDECLLKGGILSQRRPTFELLETLRWTPSAGYALLARHLERLRASADYFDFPFSEREARGCLDRAVQGCTDARRVRLLVASDGAVRAEHTPLVRSRPMLRVLPAAEPVDPRMVWLFHKTTNRDVYTRAMRPGVDEVVLWNDGGEVTETTTSNIVADFGEGRVTPAVGCGLLAGTFRAELLARREVREAVIPLDTLRRAPRFWLVNSVHDWRIAEWAAEP